MGCWKKSLSILRKLFNRNKTPNRVIGMGTLGIANDCRGQLSLLLDSWDSNLRAGLEIRPVFAKLRFWVCRTLEFFAWVFEKNQGFLKKSYVNWSRILSLVNRFWIFIGISNDSFFRIIIRSFLPIFRFFFFEILSNPWVLLLSYWVFPLSFELFSPWVFFHNVQIRSQ